MEKITQKISLSRPLWLEINLKNLDYNVGVIRKIIKKDTKIIAVIKADAYGHGAVKVAQRLEKLKVDYLAVASLEEAIELRENNIKLPILVFGYIDNNYLKEIVRYKITPTVFSFDFAKKLNQYANSKNIKIKVQIKVDTGMNRLGFPYQEAVETVRKISKLGNLKIEGIFSHLACSKQKNNNINYLQFQRFKKVLEDLEKLKIKIGMQHLANSGAIINYPEFIFNAVRPGEMLYGFTKNTPLPLKPLLSFKTKIVSLKEVKKNERIGYDQSYQVLRDSRTAIIPVGYADGYPRLLSNRGEVLIKGQRAKITGLICMDLTMVDASTIKGVKLLDEVILIGESKKETIKIQEIAELSRTIPDEIASRIGKRVPRIYTG